MKRLLLLLLSTALLAQPESESKNPKSIFNKIFSEFTEQTIACTLVAVTGGIIAKTSPKITHIVKKYPFHCSVAIISPVISYITLKLMIDLKRKQNKNK